MTCTICGNAIDTFGKHAEQEHDLHHDAVEGPAPARRGVWLSIERFPHAPAPYTVLRYCTAAGVTEQVTCRPGGEREVLVL